MRRTWIGHGICDRCGYRGPMPWFWLDDDKFAVCVECDATITYEDMEDESD